jgi:hypothetical protein
MKKMKNPGCIREEKPKVRMKGIKHLFKLVFFTGLIIHTQFLQAQAPLVTITMKNADIEEVLSEIQNQTGYNYLLNLEEIPEGTRISINIKNATIEETLNQCLKGLPLTYEIKNKVIIIVPVKNRDEADEHAEQTLYQTIRGRVIDKESGTALPGANVIVLNSNPVIGSIADENGNFRLEKVPVGRHTLQASFIGYEEDTKPEILVGSAKEVILTFKLTESAEKINEVVIRPYAKGNPKNDMATVSARSFSVEESQRYAGSAGDPGRMALSFAGINTDDDASNQIVIRGNSPNAMLWKLEGIQIPIPNHFSLEGWDAGYVSLLNPKMLGPSDFFTGAFPAEYGNATSGVFDLTFRNGNSEKHEHTVEIGSLGADITSEGPLHKNYKGSYLVNYRYATFSIMNLMGIRIDGDVLPDYSDLSFKVNLPAKKAGTFSIWGLGGTGYVEDAAVTDTSLWNEFSSLQNGNSTRTHMAATGITHTLFPDHKSYFKTILSFSGNSSIDKSYKLEDDFSRKPTYFEKLYSSALRFSLNYNRKFSSKVTFKTGFIFSKLFFDYYSKFIDEDENPDEWIEDIDGKGNSETYQGYLQGKYRFSQNFSVNAGFHCLNFALNREYSIEPRLGFEWNLPHLQTVSGGFGMHSRHDYLMTYFTLMEDENGDLYYPNKNLKLQKSTHYILGYTKMFAKDLKLKVEVYYQDLSDLPVSADSAKTWSPINDDVSGFDFVSDGTGRNYGIEFTLEKYFTRNYYFLITTSLFDAKYKPLDGNWYNTRYNNKHITKISAGKEYRIHNKNILGINGRFIWTGGRRDTPIDQDKVGIEKWDVSDQKRTNAVELAPYLRLDIGVSYRINNKRASHEILVDIQNVTNRENIGGSYYDDENEKQIIYTLQGILPTISYRIYF